MWELCNRPTPGEEWSHPCLARSDEKAFIQLRQRETSPALVIAWSAPDIPIDELLPPTHRLAQSNAVSDLLLTFNALDKPTSFIDADKAVIV
jgi:hypothetical protein